MHITIFFFFLLFFLKSVLAEMRVKKDLNNINANIEIILSKEPNIKFTHYSMDYMNLYLHFCFGQKVVWLVHFIDFFQHLWCQNKRLKAFNLVGQYFFHTCYFSFPTWLPSKHFKICFGVKFYKWLAGPTWTIYKKITLESLIFCLRNSQQDNSSYYKSHFYDLVRSEPAWLTWCVVFRLISKAETLYSKQKSLQILVELIQIFNLFYQELMPVLTVTRLLHEIISF